MQVVPTDTATAVPPSAFNDGVVGFALFNGEKDTVGCTITVKRCKFHPLILLFEQPYDEPKALVEDVFRKIAFIETEDIFPSDNESTMLRKLAVRRLVARDIDKNIIFTLNGWTVQDYLLAFKELETIEKVDIASTTEPKKELETGNPEYFAELLSNLEREVAAGVPVKKETKFNRLLGIFGKKQ